MSINFKMIAATDVGQVREHNEDSVRIVPDFNIAVVADGMGGHKAGEIASKMAVTTFCKYYEEQFLVSDDPSQAHNDEIMMEAIKTANSEVYGNGRNLAHMEGMGTTLVAASFADSGIKIGHIGDSRVYRFSSGELTQLTTDHTLANDLLQEHPDGHVPSYSHHVLKKALGIEANCEPDVFTSAVDKGDIFLLCSDGLTGVVEDSDIATVLTLRAHEPELCIDTLIRACLMGGAPDNVTVVLVFAD